MWNEKQSIRLSSICTKAVILLAFALAVALPFLYRSDFFTTYGSIGLRITPLLLLVVYACYVPGLAALFCLNRLLTNIKNGNVFTAANVRALRAISWACYGAAAILAAGTFISVFFCFMAVLVAFIGLIARVVKNVFAAAVELKNENDLTI
ncbi:MAG: DUF2975 domain-containing protein [Clostridiales Family XIII bacterium]|nr:DUF2975 domain-containing protein [Clostridiales Family XIII bacterium]